MPKLLSRLPDQSLAWPIAWPAVSLIALDEGCALEAYQCPASVWTIGFGHTDGVYAGETWTTSFADETFCRELGVYAAKVKALCKTEPNINELGALVSFSYNVGLGALAKSPVLAAHNRGDKPAAAQGFSAYNKAKVNGKYVVLAGLARRRAQEAALYLTPDTHAVAAQAPAPASAPAPVDAAPAAIQPATAPTDAPAVAVAPQGAPQAVATPASLVTHPVSLGGMAAAGVGVINAAQSLSAQVQTVTANVQTVAGNAQTAVANGKAAASTAHDVLHTVASLVGLEPWMLVSGALVAAGAGLIFWLRAQRRAGKL